MKMGWAVSIATLRKNGADEPTSRKGCEKWGTPSAAVRFLLFTASSLVECLIPFCARAVL